VMTRVGAEFQSHLAALAMRDIPADRVQDAIERSVNRVLEHRLARRHQQLLGRLRESGPGAEQDAIQQELKECAGQLMALRGRRVVG
jgi:hypothetical protein